MDGKLKNPAHNKKDQNDQLKMINGIPMYENKQERAQATLKIIEDGKYKVAENQKEVEVNIQKEIAKCVQDTKLYDPEEELPIKTIQPNSQLCDIQITTESTLQAAKRIQSENKISNVAVLNFASAIKPGGGWLNGREAQEECITRQSALYLSLTAKQCNEFYSHHEALLDTYSPEAQLYTNYMIYSPKVPVIRDATTEELISPYYVSFITSPAPNLKRFKENYRQEKRDEVIHEHLSKKKDKTKPDQQENQEQEEENKEASQNNDNENNSNNAVVDDKKSQNEEKAEETQKGEEKSQEINEKDELAKTSIEPAASNSLQYSYEPFEYSESYGPEHNFSDSEYEEIENETDELVKQGIEENYKVMYSRIKRILEISILNHNDSIILGAFGCGVFGNDPSEVSTIFRRLIIEEKYGYYFKVIVFAILGNPKGYTVNCFKDKLLTNNKPNNDHNNNGNNNDHNNANNGNNNNNNDNGNNDNNDNEKSSCEIC